MAEVSGYSLLTMSEIRVCNPKFPENFARIFSTGVAMKLIAKLKVIAVAKWICQKSVTVTKV